MRRRFCGPFELHYERYISHLHRRRIFDLHAPLDRMPVDLCPSCEVLHLHALVCKPHPSMLGRDTFALEAQNISRSLSPKHKLRLPGFESTQYPAGTV
jgi:hypothetical protein